MLCMACVNVFTFQNRSYSLFFFIGKNNNNKNTKAKKKLMPVLATSTSFQALSLPFGIVFLMFFCSFIAQMNKKLLASRLIV